MNRTRTSKTSKGRTTASAAPILRRIAGKSTRMRGLLERERLSAAPARNIGEPRTARAHSKASPAAMVATPHAWIARLEDADYDGHSLTMLRRIAEALGCNVEIR